MRADPGSAPWHVASQTISEMFTQTARAVPERTYIKAGDLTLSYGQVAQMAQAVAQALGPEAQGRTVALVLPNSAAFLVAYYGVLAAGAAPALLNHAHPDATVGKLLEGLDVAAVLSDRDLPGLEVTPFDDAGLAALTADGAAPDPAAATPDQPGAILFSGGTTGLPKQVPHSHDALIKKVERMEWGWPTKDGEVWLPVAPFTHVYGFLMGVLNPVLRGGTLVIPPRFHPDLIVQMLQEEQVTVFGGGPPAIYQAIMASEAFGNVSFPHLRVCPGGGAPFPLAVHERWAAATGLPITVNTESDGMKPGAAGKPVPDTAVEIVDLATGDTVLPIGESGEIRVRGPHMMTGYTGNPDETALTLRGRYVYTGDIGSMDEYGFLTISDRKKDVIFVKGFNVFPREVEEVLLAHAAVSGACVVGRADDRAGEVPVAYVTLRMDVLPAALSGHCETLLTAYKLPAEIVVLEALPMTPAAKVDRAALRARANESET